MIIEFSVTNYRSFKETQTFSIVAGNYTQHTETNSFDPKVEGIDKRLLCSAAIYGANAAGKTNLLRSIHLMQWFVLNSANPIKNTLHDPFKFSASTRNAPSTFVITFIHNKILYEYRFSLGPSNKIEEERLIEFLDQDEHIVFERTFNKSTQEYDWNFPHLEGNWTTWKESTRQDALFLTIAYQLNSKQLAPVFEWFHKFLVVSISGTASLNPSMTIDMLKEPESKEILLSFIQEADFGVTDLEINRDSVALGTTPKITFSHFSDDENYSTLDLTEESHGTQRFFQIAGAWKNVIKHGVTLLVDEIESSFHPQLVRFLIKKFHSEENSKNAQLVFTTHSTELLDEELLRRDQIWFVEKERFDEPNQIDMSKLYPLSDFKPRDGESLQQKYLQGRFGALPIIDQS
ncbi:MAG: AAA family ATPase [Alphaproteobacteria bacterium]